MGLLSDEVNTWNTSLLGAFVLWRFSIGYRAGHPNGEAPPALLHFLVSGIFSSPDLIDPVSNLRDNLQSYARHFESKQQIDLLLGLQNKILSRRAYTLQAIDVAMANGMLVWDKESGRTYPRELTKKPRRGNALPSQIKRYGEKAEILGRWFSEHELHIVLKYLKVVL